ncbi:MAG: AsmA-like C-terminal region-containing protein [Planctomycetota bacterium]|jgi:hypothetical protein|nr:AsmA-like C-terminal region-containing protein [Planctomycetota bacterium]
MSREVRADPFPEPPSRPGGGKIRLPQEAVPVSQRTLRQRLLRLAMGAVLMGVVALAVAPSVVGLLGRGWLEKLLSRELEATVRVDSLSLSLSGATKLEGVVLEDPTRSGESMISLGTVTGRLKWLSLFRGDLALGAIRVHQPTIHLVRFMDGSFNLEHLKLKRSGGKPGPPPPVSFDLLLEEGRLDWTDLQHGVHGSLEDLSLDAKLEGLDQAIPIRLSARNGRQALRTSGSVRLFDASRFDPWIDFHLDLEKSLLGAFASYLPGVDSDPTGFRGRIKWSGSRFSVVRGILEMGGLVARGGGSIDHGQLVFKGMIQYDWETLPRFLDHLVPPAVHLRGGGMDGFQVEGTLDRPRIRVDLRAQSLAFKPLKFGAVKAQLRWKPGKLDLQPFRIEVRSGGNIEGSATLDLRQKGKTPWSLVLSLDEVALSHHYGAPLKFLGPIFYLSPDASGTLSGKLSGDIQVRALDFDRQILLDSLVGEGTLEIVDGRIEGEGLYRKISKRLGKRRGFSFSRLSGGFGVANRWVETRNLHLGGRGVHMVMNGRTNLDGRIDYTVRSDFVSLSKLGKYAHLLGKDGLVPLRIVGTWSRPHIALGVPGVGDLDPVKIVEEPLEILIDPLDRLRNAMGIFKKKKRRSR